MDHESGYAPGPAPETWEPLLRLARLARRPLERFLRIEAASGVLLLVAAAVALAWANSPWASGYVAFWHTPIGFRIGAVAYERSLEWVVNDGLMVLFFFVVGLEIRRELHQGELSEWRRAAIPAGAALGGMLAPAALYLALAGAPETRAGWGVPMATDIAFALGVLALLGRRVPPALRVLLLALAVIDDLGAIVVIALFYSSGLVLSGLLVAAIAFAAIFAMQGMGVRAKLAYVPPSLVIWAGILAAGIHPTIAGVLIGLATPVRAWLGPDGFLHGVEREVARLARENEAGMPPGELAALLHRVDVSRREAISPAERLIEVLHPWVAFGIMPIFALANAGVALAGPSDGTDGTAVAVAVALGLLLGKPLGVVAACTAMLKWRIGMLPIGLTRRHLWVLGVVAGVGFTMALFVAQLAFVEPRLLAAAKLGVLAASAGAALVALGLGFGVLRPTEFPGAARTADEAESSTEA